MIGEKEAGRLAELGLHGVQVSVYSHRPEVHDRITKVWDRWNERWRDRGCCASAA